MKAIITSYRRSRHVQHMNTVLLKPEKVDNDVEAHKLLGKIVRLKTKSGKLMQGKVVAIHGKKGVVRARFSKGVPGEALYTEVEIVS